MKKTDNNFLIKPANEQDLPEMRALMRRSIKVLQKGFLSPKQIEASFEIMGLDSQLITDKTYFIAKKNGEIAGCGGWSKRQTLYGGDHSKGRNARLLDPKSEPARIRAMYTHPDFARQGVARLILQVCEKEAIKQGFRRAEMMATLAGVPLYRACGYKEIEKISDKTTSGIEIPLIRMGKTFSDRLGS